MLAARGLSLSPGEGAQAQRRERMNSVPPQPPAPSRQLPATLLKIPGPGPGPGHSVSGLEVAQSWGNPGRQVSDASRSRKWWNWPRNWIRAGSSHFKEPSMSPSFALFPVWTCLFRTHARPGGSDTHPGAAQMQGNLGRGEILATTWCHLCPELIPSQAQGGHRDTKRCNEEGWFLLLVPPPGSCVLPLSQSLGTQL